MLQTKKLNIFYILLALGCMNVFGKGSIVLLLLCIYELFRRRLNIVLDRNAIAISLFTVCVILVSVVYYSYSECLKALNYLLLYLLGYDTYRRANNKEQCVENSVFAICAGFGIELVLMYLYNYNREQESVRTMYSVWTQEKIAVTLLGLLVSVIIGFSFYCFFISKKKPLKITVLIMLAVGLFISFDTATRTPFVLFCCVYAFMLVLYWVDKRETRAIWFVVLAVVMVLFIVLAYNYNLAGLKSALEEEHLFLRFMEEGLESGRIDIAKLYFEHMPEYLWGGGNIEAETGRGAHNYLQQAYDLYGVIAFVFLLLISVQLLSNLIKMAFKKGKTELEYLFVSMYLSIIIQMCAEPIFTGYPILIWSLMLIHGLASAHMKEWRCKQHKIKEANI